MATLTNIEGSIFTYTNEYIEIVLLQFKSNNDNYTTDSEDATLIKN